MLHGHSVSLLVDTIFWRRGWRKLLQYHLSTPSNRPVVGVRDGQDGKQDYSTTLYIDARGITVDNRKRALLLHLARPAVQDIFATHWYTRYTEALNSLETYFSRQKNLQFERHSFRQAHQAANEPVDQYTLSTSHGCAISVKTANSTSIRSMKPSRTS